VIGEDIVLFSGQRVEKQESLLANQPLSSRELRSYRNRIRIVRERDRLLYGRKIHVISGNRWRPLSILGVTSFHPFDGLVFSFMVGVDVLLLQRR
jgi:hypothetical protein